MLIFSCGLKEIRGDLCTRSRGILYHHRQYLHERRGNSCLLDIYVNGIHTFCASLTCYLVEIHYLLLAF